MIKIHPSAIVHKNAEIADNVTVGPYCIVGEFVKIGEGTELCSNVIIDGDTVIGKNNKIFHSAVLGTEPQDLKYKGEPTRLRIGDENSIREFATLNKSATMDEDVVIGNRNLLMAYTHVAHNCRLGNNIILANAVNLAGHVHIDDFAIIGGMTAVHQFVKIGAYAFVGGKSGAKKDVPPYTRGEGMPYEVVGINSVGLQRRGFSEEVIADIKKIYRLFYRSGLNVTQAIDEAEKSTDLSPEIICFIDFVKNSERGICRGRKSKS
ncbi:MAG: acyl-[acyl-carrier-protein]--UDP-N-acetylglucosamine O-acyltransferase [Candidatus Cloacimonadota bacterium]|nr:MAG: acyl-[acyl-carrier-protein]--UDP-N-acetylglucosamine O-acyltransferase [Candidatus Cloacimonadota bacterium]